MTEALRQHFRPEFLNRIDEIVFFHALGLEHMKSIVDIQVRGLLTRLADRKIQVELTDAAKGALVDRGLRPGLRRPAAEADMQRRILDPLALKVLEGEVKEGDTVRVDTSGGTFTFGVTHPAGHDVRLNNRGGMRV